MTLITAQNGSGKSLVCDALCFGLYGKPFRSINKNQLVNSINNKDCLVELEFDCNGVMYKIVRGHKPAIFEIYCNGELINQDAASRDYQEVLTKQILRMSYNTFNQVVILGTTNYIPFMSLSASQRREVIEELLDIKVFSSMAQLAKDEQYSLKSQIDEVNTKIDILTSRVEVEENAILKQQEWHQIAVDQFDDQIDNIHSEINLLENQITNIMTQVESIEHLTDSTMYESKLTKLKVYREKIQINTSKQESKKQFFDQYPVCPSCSQPIDHDHKHKFLGEIDLQLNEFESAMVQLNQSISENQNKINTANLYAKQLATLTHQLNDLNMSIKAKHQSVTSIQLQKETAKNHINVNGISSLIIYGQNLYKLKQHKKKLLIKKNLIDTSVFLLRDSGIKTTIIKQYLPIFNTMINKYLGILDLFVMFELDEQFNETIKSRHRDNFSYSSFSMGERMKIDISILLAWRELTRAKASIQTNLLILDELLDSSIDTDGIATLFNLFYSFTDTNLFIISHRPEWIDKFPNTIQLEKRNGFTQATQS